MFSKHIQRRNNCNSLKQLEKVEKKKPGSQPWRTRHALKIGQNLTSWDWPRRSKFNLCWARVFQSFAVAFLPFLTFSTPSFFIYLASRNFLLFFLCFHASSGRFVWPSLTERPESVLLGKIKFWRRMLLSKFVSGQRSRESSEYVLELALLSAQIKITNVKVWGLQLKITEIHCCIISFAGMIFYQILIPVAVTCSVISKHLMAVHIMGN